MHKDGAGHGAQDIRQFAGTMAANACCIDGIIFGKAARDCNAIVIADVDNVAAFKLALHRQGACG